MNDDKPFISDGGKIGLAGALVIFLVIAVLMHKAGKGTF